MILITDAEWKMTAEELYKLQQQLKSLEKYAEELKDKLKALSQNEAAHGGGFRFNYTERKGNVDYAKIPELKAVNLELYRKEPVRYWKLELELI